MSADVLPIAYVETNWLVALGYPHDHSFPHARQLFEDGAAGRCEIRVPFAALLEAPHGMRRKTLELNRIVSAFKNIISVAVDNGEAELEATLQALDAEGLEKYVRRDVLTTIQANVSTAKTLPFDQRVMETMEEIRPLVKHGGGDAADLAILATVIVDRRQDGANRPAILFSTNAAEFDPQAKKAKVPAELLDQHRIAFYADFDLKTAVERWRVRFATNA